MFCDGSKQNKFLSRQKYILILGNGVCVSNFILGMKEIVRGREFFSGKGKCYWKERYLK